MSSSNAFIRDPASHPSQSFVKAFSDNQSPADADAPNADIAAVPGHMNENADPTPFVPVDANRAIEEGYATIQVKSQELMNGWALACRIGIRGPRRGMLKYRICLEIVVHLEKRYLSRRREVRSLTFWARSFSSL
ncbi:hypothetical protein FRB93_010877 [Tulasnella sp. JGI-2019a]|nr:hypothetical protein FRB93_010877 [Tulasnella sp. JGI-2019a]